MDNAATTATPVRQYARMDGPTANEIVREAIRVLNAHLGPMGVQVANGSGKFDPTTGKLKAPFEFLVKAQQRQSVTSYGTELTDAMVRSGQAPSNCVVQRYDAGEWYDVLIIDRKLVNYSFEYLEGPQKGKQYRARFGGFRAKPKPKQA